MKKIFIIALFFIVGADLFAQSNPDWKWIHPRPQGQTIEWFKMIDASNWVAGTDYGSFLKTTNAGASWYTTTGGYKSTLYPGSVIFQNIKGGYFLNANTGFLGYQSVAGIVKTTNGGQTLDTIRILASGTGTVYGFSFINASTGYLSGTSTYKVMKTTNGGMNWVQLPNLGSYTFYSVYASDTNNIITTSTSGNVYITTDAGQTWTTSNVGATSTLYNSYFINPMTGYVCGSSGLVRFTTNGGLNWTGTSTPTTSTMYNVVASGSDVYVAGTVSTQDIYKSTDNGNTWTAISFLNSGQMTTTYIYGFDKLGSTMVVTGSYGEMLKTTNDGSNWSSMVYRKSVANLSGDLYASSSGRIIAIGVDLGYNDAIVNSSDGGINWNPANFIMNGYLSDINMLNPTTGFICGRYGIFYKTTNGGVTWDTTLSNHTTLVSYFCNGVSFINSSTGWIVGGIPGIGGNTKIFKTTDGGSNWNEQISAYSGPVGVKIQMLNANTGYMTHSAGLQKTTNGGENWSLTTQPSALTGVSYTPVKVVDQLNVFTGGSNSQVYGTSDGGTNWDSLNFPVKAGTIFCTDWYNSQIGCAGAVIGVVGKTTNRGQSWEIWNIGGYTVYAVQMVHPDTIIASCGNTSGAQIFKYTKSITTGGITYENKIPKNFILKQNYPNPFNPVTKIEFDLPKAGNVTLKIFDIAGREVSKEINGLNLIAGNYKVNFNGSRLSSGVYFYSLVLDGKIVDTKKMLMIK